MNHDANLGRKRLYWVFFSVFFLGFPAVFLAWAGGRLIEREERAEQIRRERLIDEALLAVPVPREPEQWLARRLETAFHRIMRQGSTPADIKRFNETLERLLPGVCSLVWVNEQGELIAATPQGPAVPRIVIRKLFLALRELWLQGGNNERLRRDWLLFKGFGGPELSWEQFDTPVTRPLSATFEQRRRWFFPIIGVRGGVFGHFSQTPDLQRCLLRLVVQHSRPRLYARGIELGFLDLEHAPPEADTAFAFGEAQRRRVSRVDHQGRLYQFISLSPARHLFARSAAFPVLPLRRGQPWAATVLFGALLYGLIVSCRVLVAGESLRFSLQYKVPLLFAALALFPLGTLMILSFDFLDQKHVALLEQECREVARQSGSLDAGFVRTRRKLEHGLRALFSESPRRQVIRAAALRQTATKTGLMNGNSVLYVFGNAGELKTRIWGKESRGVEVNPRVLGLFCSRILSMANPAMPLKTARQDDVLESMVASPETIREGYRSLGRIHRYTFGGATSWGFLCPWREPGQSWPSMVLFMWGKGTLEWFFLKNNQRQIARFLGGGRVTLIRPDTEHRELELAPGWEHARSLVQRLQKQGGSSYLRHQVSGQPVITIGVCLPQLNQAMVLVQKSEASIIAALQNTRALLVAFGVLCAAACFWLSRLLVQQVLVPIQALAAGVTAVEQREFSFRLPALGPDELGQTAAHFNDLLENLADLDTARIVQETLLPKNSVTVSGAEAFGKTHSAGEIGGDFFDLRRLDDHSMLVGIGDFSGHGIPAALGVAAMKAMMDVLVPVTTDPVEILGRLNQRFRALFTRRQMMTFLLGVLNSDTGEFIFASAGHCCPFFLDADGAPRMIECSGPPLGCVVNRSSTRFHLTMPPGSTLVLYTDFLAEATAAGVTIGFPQALAEVEAAWAEATGNASAAPKTGTPLQESMAAGSDTTIGTAIPKTERLVPEAAELCQRVFDRHARLIDPGQDRDDLTVVVVRRTP
jgi:HAMP domain-containing protein